MNFISTEGYFISRYQFGQGDFSLKFFSEKLGLVRAVADRQKAAHYPIISCLTPLDRADLTLLARRHRSDARLTDLQLVERHMWLTADARAMGLSMLILEIVGNLLPEDEPHVEMYELMGSYLKEVKAGSPVENAALHTILRYFRHLGYGLSLDECRLCQQAPQGPCCFLPASGGFLHKKGCSSAGRQGMEVSPGTLLFLNRLSRSDLEGVRRIKGDGLVLYEAFKVINVFLGYLCQRRLASQDFLLRLSAGGG
jgi:DNA repair protein RecO